MRERLKFALNILISVLFIALIVYFAGYKKVFSVFSEIDLILFLSAVVMYIVVNLLMSLRIRLILSRMGKCLSMKQIIPSHFAGMVSSDFTPARVGYFFTAFSLSSKYDIPVEKSIMSIFGPQLLDFIVKSLSAMILVFLMAGALGLGDDGILLNVFFLFAFIFAVIFSGLLLFYPPFVNRLEKGILEKTAVLPAGASSSFTVVVSKSFSFLKLMQNHSKSILELKAEILLIGILSWIAKGFEWLLLAWAVGITLGTDFIYSLGFMMVFQASITILQFLPLPTIAGAGASEIGFAAILHLFGVSPDTAVGFGLLTRMLMIAVNSFAFPVVFEYLGKHSFGETIRKLKEMKNQ